MKTTSNHPHHHTTRQALSLTAGLLILTPCANAAPFWIFDNGGNDANFGNALNWDSNTVPGANEGAVINGASPNVELLITSSQTVDTLRINDGRTVTQSGGTLTISKAGSGHPSPELGLWIGEFGGGNVYNMNGGEIVIHDEFDGLILGKNAGSEGTMNFSSGTITYTAGDTFIGADQKGTWNQSGGTFTAGTVYLARWGSPNVEQGFVNLNGGTFSATRVQKGDGNEAFFNFNGGTLQARASVGDFFHSMTRANVRNGGAIIDTNGHTVTVAQALVHSDIGGDDSTDGGLAKNGSGNLILSGWNSYTGATNVNAGTLTFGAGGSAYDGGQQNGAVNVNDGGTLSFARNDTFGNAAALSPVVLTVNSGGNVTSNGHFNTFYNAALNGGTITANGGLNINGDFSVGAFGFKGTLTVNGAGTSSIVNAGGNDNYIRLGREGTNEATTFDVTQSTGLLDVDVELRDNFNAASGLAKTGAGSMRLDSTASHTGATTVTDGTLLVNGAITASSNVSVAADATLGGNGSLNANTTIQGLHAPGESFQTVGLQTFGGDLTYSGASATFGWDISYTVGDTGTLINGGLGYDQVSISGNLLGTNGGESIFQVGLLGGDFSDAFWSVDRSWDDVFTSGNAVDLNDVFAGFTYGEGTSPDDYGSFSFNQSSLVWTAVPEPKAALLGALGIIALLRRRR
jgi:autotransporter-associated beta strand protein